MFKKHLKHLLSIALAFTLSLSTPLTTLAANGDVQDSANNTGGGSGSMSTTTSSLAWSANAQGYRIYIIDRNFQRISPVYDFYYSTPRAGNYCWNTRFDTPSSPDEHYHDSISILQEWCDSSESVPKPTEIESGIRVGNGQKFKEWFFGGRGGFDNLLAGSGSSSFGPSLSGSSSTQSYPNTVIATRIYDTSTFMSVSRTDITRGILQPYAVAPPDTMLYSRYDKIQDLSTTIKEVYEDITDYLSDEVGKWVDTNGDGVGDHQITENDILKWAAYSANKSASYDNSYSDVGAAWYMYVYGATEFRRLCSIIYSSGGTSAHTPTQNLLTQSIPLSGGTGGTGGDGTPTSTTPTPTPTTPRFPAYYLVNKDDTIRVPGYDNAALALQDNCYMVVEPITWLYVRTTNGAWDNPSSYESTRTYGTFWNLANKWNSTAGFYNTIMTKLFNNCLTTTTTTTSPTGAVIHGITDALNQRSIANSVELMNASYGLSMHLYDASAWDGLPVVTEYLTSTHAHQTTTLTNSTPPVAVSDKTMGGKQYTVVQWETSTVDNTETLTPASTWDEMTATSTKTQSGTTPTTVDISTEEKVLYIQLIESLAPTASLGDWNLTESKLSVVNSLRVYFFCSKLGWVHVHNKNCHNCQNIFMVICPYCQ